jgi:hypothetical protein
MITKRMLHTVRIIRKEYSYTQLKKIGAKLAKASQAIDLKHLDMEKGNFFISKEKETAGKRSWTQPKGKFRKIVYLKSKEARRSLNHIANIMDICSEEQHGFRKNKDIKSAVSKIVELNGKKVLLIDLENAFNQVKYSEIFYIFHKIFRLNKHDSKRLTESSTINGYMYQGSPLSPMLFNIMSKGLIGRISGIIPIVQYADDLTLISRYEFISYKFERFIYKIIEECGWTVNKSKTQHRNIKQGFITLGCFIKRRSIRARNFSKNMKGLYHKNFKDLSNKSEKAKIVGKIIWLNANWTKFRKPSEKLINSLHWDLRNLTTYYILKFKDRNLNKPIFSVL